MISNDVMNTVICSDAKDFADKLPNNSVNCVVSSPPYYQQRDYGGIVGQIGLEDDLNDYINNLVDIFSVIKDKLKPDGVVWVNLGDSYSSGGRGGGESHTKIMGKKQAAAQTIGRKKIIGYPNKTMLAVPQRFAIAMIDAGWRLRSTIIWHKPNAMPSSAVDRPAMDYEYVFMFVKSNKYYYDQDAAREPYRKPMNRWGGDKLTADGESIWDTGTGQTTYRDRDMRPNKEGRGARAVWRQQATSNRDGKVWSINTSPSDVAHYATMSKKLVERCILITSKPGDVVYDPFMGAGTTGLVAAGLGRNYIGSELNPEYVALANDRIKNQRFKPSGKPVLFAQSATGHPIKPSENNPQLSLFDLIN